MRTHKLLLSLLIAACLSACTESRNSKLIVGNWAAMQWLVEGNPSVYDIRNTAFSFDSTGHYTFTNGGNTEKGTYKLENDMLFTTPSNEKEMMVKIEKLTSDSLVFDMNRGGQAEQLTLTRK